MKRVLNLLALGLGMIASWPLAARDFAPVVPGRNFAFPRDHGAHPEFQNEWWYVTGHVKAEDGREFGLQWTVFRAALPPPSSDGMPGAKAGVSAWRADQLYLGHAAFSDLSRNKFSYAESAARGALGLAAASKEKLELHLPEFRAETKPEGWTISAQGGEFSYRCILSPAPIALQGQGGYSPKAADGRHASYYYSIPRQRTHCDIQAGEERIEAASGEAWFDHEFGSNQLGKTQTGWDWFGLQLGEGRSLMVYRLRDRESPDFVSGMLTDADGTPRALTGSEIRLIPSRPWKSTHSDATYPTSWKIEIPSRDLALDVTADFADQELITRKTTQVTYWEGSVSVTEKKPSGDLRTKGYLEMTGYDERNAPKL